MKPIFDTERLFLQEQLKVKIPSDCWRDGVKIFLDCTCKKPLYVFNVINNELRLQKDNTKLFVDYKQIIIKELIENNTERLSSLKLESENKTNECLDKFNGYEIRIGYSGGKDSDVMINILIPILERRGISYTLDYNNPTNETAQTYKHVKRLYNKNLSIHNPDIGWITWIMQVKNYFIPSIMVRNCCSTYKEGQVKKYLDKKVNYINFLGMRKYESSKRSKYDWYINDVMGEKLNIPINWVRFLPIVEWTDVDIWLYILQNNIEVNRMYELGFNRVGCLICPYQSDYIDVLIKKYYSSLWNRWVTVLNKNYEIYNIGKRLKWSLNEWVNGKWKAGTSKEYEIINKSASDKNIQELANLKVISFNMAKKFFNKKCSCEKKLNPTELSMFYKLFGRHENVENDNRSMLCKKCLCQHLNITKYEYLEKQMEFTNSGCNLF